MNYRTFMTNDGLQFLPVTSSNQIMVPVRDGIYGVYDNVYSDGYNIYTDSPAEGAIVSIDNLNGTPVIIEPRPIYRSKNYEYSINEDRDLQKSTVKYFFLKFKDSWLPKSYLDLQRYLEVDENGDIKFVKNLDDYKKETASSYEKMTFIHEEIFTKDDMKKFLIKYVRNEQVKWYDLKKKYKSEIKDELHNKLKHHIRKLVLSKL